MRRLRSLAALLFSLSLSVTASAGPIALENESPGDSGWMIKQFGNAQGPGSIDLYPAAWSIARGETVRLKVRSTGSYSVHVYRLGWYGGAGAKHVLSVNGKPAEPQPYPTSDPKTGLVEARWNDSVSFVTDSSWAPGLYVARADHSGGGQAMTFFTIRDGDLPSRMPILVAITTATHQAYNGWPGASRGGKSLYGFNSSGSRPSESFTNQAVKVSYDRPFLVGGGTGDVLRYEYPFLRWAERNGWDVAWCVEEDLARDPGLVKGRRVFTISGHWEYLSKGTYDAVQNARDSGTNLLIMSGDTIAWQVRPENDGKTLVGYKESWKKDPEQIAGEAAAKAGDMETAKKHFAVVTRGWKRLGDHAHWGLDMRRPAMGFLGVQSAGAMGPEGPWGDLRVEAADHWIFAGTGLGKGDRLPRIMGYEYDNITDVDGDYSDFVPPGRVVLGRIVHPRTGESVGASAYYKAASGAEVVALGSVNFAFGLDGWASPWKSEHPAAQKMIDNALRRWTAGAPPATEIEGSPSAPGSEPNVDGAIAGPNNDGGLAASPEALEGPGTACGCRVPRTRGAAVGGLLVALALVVRALRRMR